MITIRRSRDRGHAEHGWLESRHTFSFADYHDPEHIGFSVLRVLNEDRVQPGRGFGEHSHRDMEIISVVLEGALEHRDSLGNGSVIRPGDVQVMGAGTGVTHSEFNHSGDEPVHFLQIWVLPNRPGLEPSYAEKHLPVEERRNTLRLAASPNGRNSSLVLRQDVTMHQALLDAGASVTHRLAERRRAWLQVARGRVQLNGVPLGDGDGAAVSNESVLEIVAATESDLVLFDLP